MPPWAWRRFIEVAAMIVAAVFALQVLCAIGIWIARAAAWIMSRI
jgi:hypothetical protein